MKFDAKKINVFIGKPNVGKSNILEALSLFCAGYETNNLKFLSSFIRYNNVSNLFYDNEVKDIVSVRTNLGEAYLRYHYNNIDRYDLILAPGNNIWDNLSFKNNSLEQNKGDFKVYAENNKKDNLVVPYLYKIISNEGQAEISGNNELSIIKKYYYQYLDNKKNMYPYFLLPPNGPNLFSAIHSNKKIHKEISSLFEHDGLDFVMNINEREMGLQKKIDGFIYPYPYISIADTLQRYIFYLAMLHSNRSSVLLLEEPEVHSFPPYTGMLADKIAIDETNQYFITTHSPYLLHTLIENVKSEDFGLFLTYYENYETKVRQLSNVDIQQIVDDRIDVFFNLDRFIENER